MEIKIKFDLLNDLLNSAVSAKKDFDRFKSELSDNYKKIKEIVDDVNALIIILLIGDDFIWFFKIFWNRVINIKY